MNDDIKELKKSACMYKTVICRREIALRSEGRKIAVEDIDEFVQAKLPILIHRRPHSHITLDEYMQITKWVELREIENPTEQGTYTKPSADDVKYLSMTSFAVLAKGDKMQAISELLHIPGCDIKVASAIMSAADPAVPYLSEMLLEVMRKEQLGQAGEAPLFLQACVFARGKARALSASIPTETGTIWNAKEVEKAIFASHHMIESDY